MSASDRAKARERLRLKRMAYLRTFRTASGQLLPHSEVVLADLKKFCGINRGGIVVSPVSRMTDPYATTYQAGMRDVYLRIAKMIELDETDIQEDKSDETSTAEQ